MTAAPTVLLAFEQDATAQLMDNALTAAGFSVSRVASRGMLMRDAAERSPSLIFLEETFDGHSGTQLAAALHETLPTLPIILFLEQPHTAALLEALRAGVHEVLIPPLRTDDIRAAAERVMLRARQMGDWVRREINRTTASLRQHSAALEALLTIGRELTGTLELDAVLERIVADAVRLLDAEEGSLMLVDEETGELYVRASKNFDQNLVETLRLPVQDSLAGQVVQSGQPLVIRNERAHKIKTAYLVQALVYVPLRSQDEVIGVLGVDNRTIARDFSDEQVLLLSVLADYASVAVQNAALYEAVARERNKLDAVFRNIQNGVLILDCEQNILLMNPAARMVFDVPKDMAVEGKPASEVIKNEDLRALLNRQSNDELTYHEINTDDGNIYSAYYTPIPGLGAAVTLHNITYLKDLDQLKTDFIHTVSHDLRSPLTAVLGYTELLERVGTLTSQQAEFVRRIKQSVQSITDLVNELLDLGRIESGFDTRKEHVQLSGVLSYVLDGLRVQIDQKHQRLHLEVEDTPPVRGNPIRLRQMMDNLIGNAIKYTPEGGDITVRLFTADDQVVFEVSDTGPGIPVEDQPHIFEKFYRGGNVGAEGSGLGLAIVKSIVDSHQGRIWVNSTPGNGATFTVVLPIEH